MIELEFEAETFRIRGAVFEVYKEMGCGFLEAIYHECLEQEFIKQKIIFSSQMSFDLKYKNIKLFHTFKPDLICFDKIIVELKAVKLLTDEHRAQIQNYLKVTGLKLGLLVNFGHYPGVEIERIIK